MSHTAQQIYDEVSNPERCADALLHYAKGLEEKTAQLRREAEMALLKYGTLDRGWEPLRAAITAAGGQA
jgi:hypothetical protein